MELAQASLERESLLPAFLLAEDATLTVAAGISTLGLPTGFIRESEYGGFFRYDDSTADPWIRLNKGMYNTLKDAGYTTGILSSYALVGQTIHLFPTPETSTTLKMMYYRSGGSLTNNTATHPWLVHAPEILLHETAARIDSGNAPKWLSLADRERNKLCVQIDQRHEVFLDLRIVPE